MKITTDSSINISESLTSFMLASHLEENMSKTAIFEKRLNKIMTGKYSIADVYLPNPSVAIEVKSIAHGTSALKGVIQASVYKEQVKDGLFCMQRPRRKNLQETLESMCEMYGVGLIFIDGIPNVLSQDMIINATGGCAKPFRLWKRRRYSTTKENITSKSKSDWIKEYLETIEKIISEHSNEIFDYVVDSDPTKDGLYNIF